MKFKTLVKLFMIREGRPEIALRVDKSEYDLEIYDYLRYKIKEVLDWVYIKDIKMKLKTLIKLLTLKERRPEITLHVDNHEYDLGIYDYIAYKDKEVLDWTYINGDALENGNDKIIIYI